MIDNFLTNNFTSTKKRIMIKSLISLGIIAMAVVSPMIFHMAFGASSGVKLLPMYLPVLLGGIILGVKYGVAVGVLSPLVSYLITSLYGSPMPALARLPFMMVELGVFGLVSGMFANKIFKNSLYIIPTVVLAFIIGRGSFLGLVALFGKYTNLSFDMVLKQVLAGYPGMLILFTVCPLISLLLKKLLKSAK